MRGIPLAALALAVLLASAAAQEEPVNLLKNPGFEAPFRDLPAPSGKALVTGQLAEGWSDNSGWCDLETAYAADSDGPHGGAAAQRVQVHRITGGWLQLVQHVSLKADHPYKVSLWLRGDGFGAAEVCVRSAGKPYVMAATQRFFVSPEWREFTLAAVPARDDDYLLMILVRNPGTLWIDDSSLVDLKDAADTAGPAREGNLLPNGSFEAGLAGGWAVWVREYQRLGTAVRSEFADKRPVTDATTHVDGNASLRIEIPDARGAVLASPWVPFRFNHVYSGSLALKSDVPVSAELSIEGAPESKKWVQIGPEWKRYGTSALVPYASRTRLVARIFPAQAATVWCDAAQLEEKAAPSPAYQALYPVELGLAVERPGGIVFDGDEAPITIRTGGALPAGARLRWTVADLLSGTAALPDVPLPAAGFSLAPDAKRPRGMFKLRGEVVDPQGKPLSAPVEAIFARLPRPRDVRPEDSFFGTHFFLTPELIAIAKAVGMHWVRLHDSANLTKWRYVEETRDQFQFQDEGIDAARAAGFGILGMLDGVPPWASTKPEAKEGVLSINNLPDIPEAPELWSRYVKETVAHYKGRIDCWEVMNEPWAGVLKDKPDLYAQFLKLAYAAAKEANPQATIVGVNSVAHSNERDAWTEEALRATGPGSFDAFSVHDYNTALYGGPDSKPVKTVAKFRAMMAKVGADKPIWNSEGGGGEVNSWYWADAETEPALRRQMIHLIRFDVTQMAAGIKRFFYYTLYYDLHIEPTTFTALEHDRVIRPVLAANAVLASLVDGAACLGRTEPEPGIDRYDFRQTDGTHVAVVWSYDGGSHSLPVPSGMRALDMVGNPINGAPVPVTAEPVYLVGK